MVARTRGYVPVPGSLLESSLAVTERMIHVALGAVPWNQQDDVEGVLKIATARDERAFPTQKDRPSPFSGIPALIARREVRCKRSGAVGLAWIILILIALTTTSSVVSWYPLR